jgi:hypothetical protein
MFDAVVTFAKTARAMKGLGHEDVYVSTKVYRVEFETEEQFQSWMALAEPRAVNVEQLVAKSDVREA